MKTLRRVSIWLSLFVLLCVFGWWVHQQMPVPIGTDRDTEIYSFDFLKYANTFADYRHISYGRFRHPLWGWLTCPLALFGHSLYQVNETAFWLFLIAFFALVMVGSVWLVYRLLLRAVGLRTVEAAVVTALFVSFAHVWLLGGLPETFGVSMFLALLTLVWATGSGARCARDEMTILGERVVQPGLGRRLDGCGWGLLLVLTGGVTITQGVKTVLAFLVTHRLRRRQLVLGGVGLAGLLVLVVGVFFVRVWLRVKADPQAPGLAAAWHTIVDNIAPASLPFTERLRYVWVFFSDPILLRGEPFDQRTIVGGYGSVIQPILLGILYVLVAVSAWLNRHHLLTKLLGMMFLVDVGIHFVCQWGLAESQIYAGHWFFGIPLLVGLLFPRLSSPRRRLLLIGIACLAVAFVVCNLHGYLGHEVGIVWPPKEAV